MSFEDSLSALLEAKLAPLRQELTRIGQVVESFRRTLPPQYVAIPQAAKVLGISLSTARRRVKDGTIPVKRVGRSIRVDLTKLNGPTDDEVARAGEALKGMG